MGWPGTSPEPQSPHLWDGLSCQAAGPPGKPACVSRGPAHATARIFCNLIMLPCSFKHTYPRLSSTIRFLFPETCRALCGALRGIGRPGHCSPESWRPQERPQAAHRSAEVRGSRPRRPSRRELLAKSLEVPGCWEPAQGGVGRALPVPPAPAGSCHGRRWRGPQALISRPCQQALCCTSSPSLLTLPTRRQRSDLRCSRSDLGGRLLGAGWLHADPGHRP